MSNRICPEIAPDMGPRVDSPAGQRPGSNPRKARRGRGARDTTGWAVAKGGARRSMPSVALGQSQSKRPVPATRHTRYIRGTIEPEFARGLSLPIYEYRCVACSQKSSFFTRSVHTQVDAVCSHCGSDDMNRIISTVSFRSSTRRSSASDYYGDPSNIGRHVEDSFGRHGVDMPETIRKTIDDARRGKMPDGLDI